MDDVDRHILAELQGEARLTLTELADRVGLSPSPCHRRLRALESSGAISGYHAVLDPTVFGLHFEALVFVTLSIGTKESLHAFDTAVEAVPNVVSAQRLVGDPDYLLHVLTRDMPAFQQLYEEHLATLPGVQRLTTTLVMKTVVHGRPLPQ